MSSSAIRAGRAFVELFADDSKLQRTLKSTEKRLQAFGKNVAAVGAKLATVGAAGLGGFAAVAKLASDSGSALWDMSQRTGVSVESLSTLDYALGQSGSSIESFEKSVRKMQDNLGMAAQGSDSAAKGFDMLGLSVADLMKLDPEQQFLTVADALSKIQNPALKTSVALDVFGKSGTQLLPALVDGVEGLQALRGEWTKFAMTTRDAIALEAFGDELSKVWRLVQRAGTAIGTAVVPIMHEVAQSFAAVTSTTIQWIDGNRGLIASALQLTAGATAAGVAMFAFGKALDVAGRAVGLARIGVAGLGAVLSTAGAVLGFILTPLGLVTSALVGLGAYAVSTSDRATAALGDLSSAFGDLKGIAGETIRAVADALQRGDLEKAARVALAGVRLAFAEIQGQITVGFTEWLNGLRKELATFEGKWDVATNHMIGGVESFQQDFAAAFAEVWTMAQQAIGEQFPGFVTPLSDADVERQFRFIEGNTNAAQKRISDVTAAVDQKIAKDAQDTYARLSAANQSAVDAAQAALKKAREEWLKLTGPSRLPPEPEDVPAAPASLAPAALFDDVSLELETLGQNALRASEAVKITAEALEVGTQAAAEAFLKAQFGDRGGDRVAEQQLSELQKHTDRLRRIDDRLRDAPLVMAPTAL